MSYKSKGIVWSLL